METVTEESRCYLVRTEREFVNKELVAIGWSWVNFTEHEDANKIISKMGNHIGKAGNQIRRFVGMKQGDIVVVPLHKSVAIGIATDKILYSETDKSKDRANQRIVNFLKEEKGKPAIILRTSFDEAFQRRLKVPGMTVNSLVEFKEQIEKAISDLHAGKIFSWSDRADEEIKKLEDYFKKVLLKNIQNGKTNLQTGGVGLEHLVKDLLIVEGYTAKVMSKRAFASFADADVIASKSDKFSETKLLVQVKHHHGTTGSWGVEQLKAIKTESQKKDYSDYQLVLVTSGLVGESLRKDAENNNISVIDGNELVDWISDSLGDLPETTKIKLGICEVPQIATFS